MSLDYTLQNALDDLISEDIHKYQPAIKTLVSIGSQAIEGLLNLLQSSDDRVTERVIEVIAFIGSDVQTTTQINEILQSKYADARTDIAQAIAKADDHSLVTLMRFLQHPAWVIRHDAVNGLAALGDNVAVPVLVFALEDEHAWVRLSAVRALIKQNDKRAIMGLIRALHDQDETIRHDAALALGDFQDTRAVPELIKRLSDKAVYGLAYTGQKVCDAAIAALGKIRDARAVPHLIKLVQKRTLLSRYHAICALGEIGDAAAVPHLIDALTDERLHFVFDDKRICDFAADALAKIGTAEAIKAVEKCRRSNS
jgi:HEAT repeat protein